MIKASHTKLLCAGAAFLATGCLNASTLQTARTLDAKESEFVLGGGLYTVPQLNDAVDDVAGEDVGQIKIPLGEIMYRRGIKEGFDMGLKLTLIGTLALDGKYQLMANDTMAVATGLSLGTVNVTFNEGAADESSTRYSDVALPLYVSYDVAEPFTVYGAPKYNLRLASGDDSGMNHFVGTSAGFRLGKKVGIYAETTYLKGLTGGADILQYSGALSIR